MPEPKRKASTNNCEHVNQINSSSFQKENHHIRNMIASNPNTPEQVLLNLAKDVMPTIRCRIAEHPRATTQLLVELASDKDSDVRLAVAENKNTPPDVLSTLANDNNPDVRFGVAENPHMPEDILIKLSNDENPYVRCRALKTLQIMAPNIRLRLQMKLQPRFI